MKTNFTYNAVKDGGFRILLLSILVLFIACGSGRNSDNRSLDNLREMATSRQFEIENQWAVPTGWPRVNLIGNNNYLRFNGDQVDIYLPYFGVRHSGGGYGNKDGGILYKGTVEDLNIVEDRNKIEMRFRGERDSENLQFFITLYSNGRTNVAVNSSQRNSISYEGEVRDLLEKRK